MFNISHFLAQQKILGQARPNFFEVYIPAVSLADHIITSLHSRIYCKATQIPGVTTNSTEIHYQGMAIPLPTIRSYSDWTVTVINDVNYTMRNNLEKWVDEISDHTGVPKSSGFSLGTLLSFGRKTGGSVDLHKVLKDIYVVQYSNASIIPNTPRPTAIYRLNNAIPTEISPIELAWDANDSTEDYTVTFRYSDFEKMSLSGSQIISFIKTLV